MDNLLEQFTLAKHTGLEKPGRWELFSYQNSLKHSPLKKAANQSASELPKTPQKLLVQTSSISPTTSSQGKKQWILFARGKGVLTNLLTSQEINSDSCAFRITELLIRKLAILINLFTFSFY